MANHTHGKATDPQKGSLMGSAWSYFPHNELTEERAQYLLTTDAGKQEFKEGFRRLLIAGIVLNLPEIAGQAYSLGVVNYDQSLDKAIAAAKFDWKNDSVNSKNFPLQHISGKVKIEVYLVHFNRGISSEDAKAEIEKMGLTCATPYELMSFAKKYPDMQRKFPIVALGQTRPGSDDRLLVAYLDGDSSGRDLGLDVWGGVWPSGCRFLAFRIVSAE